MTLGDSLLVAGIFLGLFILAYCYMKKISLKEFMQEVISIFKSDVNGG